jgi:hypothetical protein
VACHLAPWRLGEIKSESGKRLSRAKHVLSTAEGSAKDAKFDFNKKRGRGGAFASLACLAGKYPDRSFLAQRAPRTPSKNNNEKTGTGLWGFRELSDWTVGSFRGGVNAKA